MISFVERTNQRFNRLQSNRSELSDVTFQELEAMLGEHTRQGNYIGWIVRDKVTKQESLAIWAYCPRNMYLNKELYPYRVKSWKVWTNSPELYADIFGS